MKPVTANALFEQASRQREQLRHARLRAVEAVVEAGDLWQFRMPLGQRLDRSQVVRKVQREERHELFYLGDDMFVQFGGARVGCTTEDHAMSGRRYADVPGVRTRSSR